MLDHVPMEERDTKGDVYEYMLAKIATARQNGEFRTPRHIIRLMVELTAPQPTDVICDPACGTAGFLVAAGEYLRERHPNLLHDRKLTEHFHHRMFHGERLLIGEDGANLVARATPVAFIARGKYWVNNHAHVMAENGRASLRFLEFFVERTDLKPFLSGTAQPKLNRSNLDRIPVPVAPLELQRESARRVAALERLNASHGEAVARIDTLFAVLQHPAFRGEL